MTNMSFEWQIDEFMIYCQSKQLRPKTMQSYEQALRLFARWCEEERHIEAVDKVKEADIRHYLKDVQQRGKYTVYVSDKKKQTNCPERRRDFRQAVSPGTINNYIRNLKVFFNWLDESFVLQKNPMKNVKQFKNKHKPKEFLSDESFRKLITSLDKSYFSEHRDFTMIVLLFDTGMRVGECSRLLIGRTEALFPITERAVQKQLALVCDYLGYEGISTHSFRKWYATEIYTNSGYDIALVQRLLQHSSAATTQRYIGIEPQRIEQAIETHARLI